MCKLEMTKKRYTDDEMTTIVQWMYKQGINTHWVTIYMYSVPNVQIVRHLVDMFNNKYSKGPMPTINSDIKGLKNVINL